MKSLERMIREKQEREARRAEKERIKKEKEAEKLKAKKLERKKKLKQKQNQKYYKKVRDKVLQERAEKGDKRAYHMVVIMKNYKRKKRIGASWWMSDAYEIYNKAREENHNSVKFPVRLYEANTSKHKDGVKQTKPVFEIMIIQRNPDGGEKAMIRNKAGKYIPNLIIDNEYYTILDKDEWFEEETFNVYGYHPKKDRKDFSFILNEMLLKDVSPDNIKRVFPYHNRVIIQYNDDIDIITCKTAEESERLHTELEKAVGNNKYVLFTYRTSSKNIASWVLNKLEEKTGWTRKACKKTDAL